MVMRADWRDLLLSIGRTCGLTTVDKLNASGAMVPILCLPTKWGPAAVASGQRPCSRCGQAVWMSPASEETLRKIRQAFVLCVECVPAFVGATPGDGQANKSSLCGGKEVPMPEP